MTSPYNKGWLLTPYPEIFQEIMMMVGLSSLESLHRCRQVCSAWNDMILGNIWESPGKRNVIKKRIEKRWDLKLPSPEEISHAKWLGIEQRQKFN